MSDTPSDEENGRVIAWMTNTFDPMLESKRASNTLIIFFVIVIALAALGIGLATTRTILPLDRMHITLPSLPSTVQRTAGNSDSKLFTCSAGRSIDAAFSNGIVDLTLSDGRALTLPQTGTGRYGNPDGSFVFSVAGTDASIEERGVRTYTNCQS